MSSGHHWSFEKLIVIVISITVRRLYYMLKQMLGMQDVGMKAMCCVSEDPVAHTGPQICHLSLYKSLLMKSSFDEFG